jgi:hypothetical protein
LVLLRARPHFCCVPSPIRVLLLACTHCQLQGAFSAADVELEQAVARVSGMSEEDLHVPSLPGASASSSESAEWNRVSRLLQNAGFNPLVLHRSEDEDGLPSFAPSKDAVREVITQVLSNYERQQASLQRALEEGAAASRQASGAAAQRQAAADEELRRANAALEAQLEVARGRLREQTEAAEEAARTAEHALGGLRHKLATQRRAAPTPTPPLPAVGRVRPPSRARLRAALQRGVR